MITLIRKLFIKNYQNVSDPKVREKHGTLASIGGVITNLVLFTIKFLIGLLVGAISIVSDSFNNLTDLISCVVSLVCFKITGKKADKDHPYGHERVEYIAGMIISFIMIVIAGLLLYTSITSLISPSEEEKDFSIWMFIVLGVSIIGKVLLGLFYNGIGKAIDSVSLKASMQDSFNDCISTGVVLVALTIEYFVGPSAWWIDPVASIFVAIFIFIAGIKSLKETAVPLIGEAPEKEFVKSIVDEVLKYDEVLGVHDVTCHSYGPTKMFMTLHAEVDGNKNMFEVHDVIDNIELQMRAKYGVLLTIHMDPIDINCEELNNIKEILKKIIDENFKECSFHDVRMVTGKTHTNIIFDLVVPFNYNISRKVIMETFIKELKKVNEKYCVVITIDNDYVG